MEYQIGEANRLGNRERNEDRFAAVETEEGVLLVLADGMGGHSHGDLAAQTLVDIARHAYLSQARPVVHPGRFLEAVVRHTHDALLRLTTARKLDSVPGTTAVLGLVQGGRLYWVHVGDSRLYLFREGVPLFRTTDHSYVERLYQSGRISRGEQDSHPWRNHITQCIGCQPTPPEVEIGTGTDLQPGDVVLLCSDGLWSALDDAQLATMLGNGELEEALERMATRAEQQSYPHSDNISLLALRLQALAQPRPAAARAGRRHGKVAQHPDDAALREAIEQIEAALRAYGDEMKR